MLYYYYFYMLLFYSSLKYYTNVNYVYAILVFKIRKLVSHSFKIERIIT